MSANRIELLLVCIGNYYFFIFTSTLSKYTCDTDRDISKPVTPNNFIMDLHLELIQAQHRVAVVLLDQLQGSSHQNE